MRSIHVLISLWDKDVYIGTLKLFASHRGEREGVCMWVRQRRFLALSPLRSQSEMKICMDPYMSVFHTHTLSLSSGVCISHPYSLFLLWDIRGERESMRVRYRHVWMCNKTHHDTQKHTHMQTLSLSHTHTHSLSIRGERESMRAGRRLVWMWSTTHLEIQNTLRYPLRSPRALPIGTLNWLQNLDYNVMSWWW